MCCACGGGEYPTVDPVPEPEPVPEPSQECFEWNQQMWQGVAPTNPAWTVCGLDVCTPCDGPSSTDDCTANDWATDDFGDTCLDYANHLSWCGNYDTDTFRSNEMCCACIAAL